MENKKRSTIYVRLLEGTETLVPVDAYDMRDGTFKIIENEYIDLNSDATSIWEFYPGDVVKCVSEDNYFIANELVNSNISNRKVYSLIFYIVRNLGKVSLDDLKGFEEEVKILCIDEDIFQRNHPIIKSWIEKNCSQVNHSNFD